MPRPLRIEYSGAIYHVMNRGDRRQQIFRDLHDRVRFLNTLTEACGKTEWQIHAYCLMSNHFHLVIETPQPNLVAGMKWLLGVYTKRFNIRHKICGHLFAGRYKAQPVDNSGNGYLLTVCDYVHLNPVRAKLIKPGHPMESFAWSSYAKYLDAPKRRPEWLRVDRLLGEHGIAKDTPSGQREFGARMEERRARVNGAQYKQLRRGWFVGNEEFRQELLQAAAGKTGIKYDAARRRETIAQKAERIVMEELKRLALRESDLLVRRKGDGDKVRIARRLRQETTMTYEWIAKRLRMGSWIYVCNLLRRQRVRTECTNDKN